MLMTVDLFCRLPVCRNRTCSLAMEQLSALLWVYFQVTVNQTSCLDSPAYGNMLLRATGSIESTNQRTIRKRLSSDCQSNVLDTCIQSYLTRRIMFNYYYDFLYVPIYTNRSHSGSTSSITLNNHDSSTYSYEFIVDDRNIGGTLHFDFESRITVRVDPSRALSAPVGLLYFFSLMFHPT